MDMDEELMKNAVFYLHLQCRSVTLAIVEYVTSLESGSENPLFFVVIED